MEKFRKFLGSLRPLPLLFFSLGCLALFILAFFASSYLRKTAKLKLGASSGLTLTADKQDSLGIFSDTTFTLKSDTDLSVSDIKKNIVVFPDTGLDIVEVNPRQFSITPKNALKDNSLYRFQVLSDQKNFSWAFQTKNDFRIVQSLPRDMSTNVPVNSGIEVTFSHENFEDISQKNYFEITPSVEGRFERHFRTLSFVPKTLSPGTLYTVKIKKGVKLSGSEVILKDDYVFQFETESNASRGALSFSRSFYEFSPSETPAIDLSSSLQNGENLSVTVFQYPSPQNFYSDMTTRLSIPSWAFNSLANLKFSTSGLTKVLEFNSPIQQQTYTSFFLFPQTLSKGFYLVQANAGGGGGITTQALIQITDLSAYTVISGAKTIAWVNDLKSGTPVSGAQVAFLGKTEKTGQDGVAFFDTPNTTFEQKDFMTVTNGSDTLFLPVQREHYWYNSDYQNMRRVMDKYWTYFYTDRPVYLPNDTVRFWGLLRDRDNLAVKQKFTVEVTRTDYNSFNFQPVVLFTKDYETSDLGTFIGEIPYTNLNPGSYNIAIKVGDKNVLNNYFEIQTYTKPAYKISLNASKQSVIIGDTITLSGQATFFEGSPVPGMDLKYSVQEKSGNITTDNLGKYSFTYTPAPSQYNSNYSPDTRYAYVTPLHPEEGMITGNTSLNVFNSSFVFYSSKSSINNQSAHVEDSLKLVDVDKYVSYGNLDSFAPAPGQQVTGEVIENEWVRKEVGTYYDFINKVTSPRYEYSQVQNKIADINTISDTSGKVFYDFAMKPEHTYNVTFRATDNKNRTTSHTIYVGSFGKFSYLNNYVYLKTDKQDNSPTTYSIGEQVNLTVMQGENPLDSSANDKFLYFFAQRGIRSYQLSDGNSISFKYPDAFIPNVFVQAVRFTGKTYQVSESLNLTFEGTSKKLTLNVFQDKNSYSPGDNAKLSVQVKDQNGSPVQSEVNFSLVDEAYYALYSNFVDPLSRIYTSVDADLIASYQSHRYPVDQSGAEGGGCFLPGTEILMASGKTQKIENIKVGDTIKTLQNPGSSKLVNAKVTQVFKHEVAGYLVFNGFLRVTKEHNLYINGRWMTAGEAKVGDYYLNSKGEYQKIYSIENLSGLNTVFNFTVDKLSTYIAGGFYVHNDKGRALFVDNAYFGSVRTGSDGKGEVQFKLPDNLTSWRITSQGVTEDLKAGFNNSTLVVKQPFFVDVVMNTQYLVEDHPQIIVRSYGEGLNPNDQVSIKVESPDLGLNKTVTIKAFESTKIDLGNLTEGLHKITFTGQSGSLSDKLIRSFSVVKSRLQVIKSSSAILSADTKPQGSSDSITTLTFSDMGLGRFYPPLLNYSYTWGDRLDQKLTRTLSEEIIKKYFDDSTVPEKLDFTPFEVPDGGYAIYPYASGDIELSAFVAALAGDRIDKVALANYFYKQLTQVQDNVRFTQSLFGLASLNEPVLVLINDWKSNTNLEPLARIYLALAQAKIGDIENARIAYKQLLSDFAQTQDQFTYMKVGKDKDSYLEATSLTAALSALLDEKEADSLLGYTFANSAKDVLLISPQMLAVSSLISQEKPQTISFSYTLNGKKVTEKLENGKTYSIELSPKDLAAITFSDISGSVGLISHYLTPLDPKNTQVSTTLGIDRSYSVKGQVTNTFNSTDLIKISLPVKFSPLSQDGCYQISDLLPSGLKPITDVYTYGVSDPNIWYPYEIDGQKVSFCVGKSEKRTVVNYYARVISSGDYKAENAVIQSLISPSVLNLSTSGRVMVK